MRGDLASPSASVLGTWQLSTPVGAACFGARGRQPGGGQAALQGEGLPEVQGGA